MPSCWHVYWSNIGCHPRKWNSNATPTMPSHKSIAPRITTHLSLTHLIFLVFIDFYFFCPRFSLSTSVPPAGQLLGWLQNTTDLLAVPGRLWVDCNMEKAKIRFLKLGTQKQSKVKQSKHACLIVCNSPIFNWKVPWPGQPREIGIGATTKFDLLELNTALKYMQVLFGF